jgi:hypothetical protein
LIVNKFNGNIDFISKYKKGSTFFFTFEIEEIGLIIPEKRETTEISDENRIMVEDKRISFMNCLISFEKYKVGRILCIDDEEFCIASMRAIMFKLGVDVVNSVDFCINGFEALEMVRMS